MNILPFEPNIPVEVVLTFNAGREIEGRFGAPVLYTLSDGRLIYREPL